ncbi:MAG: hypothetical protein ABI843_00435 [Dokdonella sp.]
MRRAPFALLALFGLFACLALARPATAQVSTPHPRLILDTPTLTALRQRANANSADWQRLKSYCDSYIGGVVNYPDESTYPDPPNIGQGYQGHGYMSAMYAEGLCYQVELGIDANAAAAYGNKVAEILDKASMPYPGPHSESPCTDDGYAIRTFGVVYGVGYDWAYDKLSADLRQKVYTAANAWITAFEAPNGCADFEYVHPQSNYFAGYFHAKAAVALATYGDNPQAPAQWDDWLNNQFATRVRPYYQLHLAGGGWPEGYGNYAPLGVFDMTIPLREVKTATGMDLIGGSTPYSYPVDSAYYAMHFTWPSLNYFDDRDNNQSNNTPDSPPGTPSNFLFEHLLGMQEYLGSSAEPVLRQYLSEVAAATDNFGDGDPWQRFLFVNPDGPTAPISSLPLSYFATGMNAVAARSDWTTNASWLSFRAGPYVNNPNQGEEYFDQGSLALVRGNQPLLVNATGQIVHDPNGSDGDNAVYNDNYGDFQASNLLSGNRHAYNVFYVRHMNGSGVDEQFGQGAFTQEDDGVATQVATFEDGGSYMALRADNLADMYRSFDAGNAVQGWSRQVIYLRPNRIVVYDRTTMGDASYDQYLAFHFPANPASVAAPSGETRLDITDGSTFAGSMTVVAPANAVATAAPAYASVNPSKVWQVQVRPADSAVSQHWLTAFDLSSSAQAVAKATPVNVTAGGVIGVVLAGSTNDVVLSSAGDAGTPINGSFTYQVPAAYTHHTVTELAPNAQFNVSVSTQGSVQSVSVTPGNTYTASAQGTLTFSVNAAGTALPPGEVFRDGFD